MSKTNKDPESRYIREVLTDCLASDLLYGGYEQTDYNWSYPSTGYTASWISSIHTQADYEGSIDW